MKALIDTNVVLDVLLNNSAFVSNSRRIIELSEKKHFIGYISASAITDIFYISRKKLGKKVAKEAIKHLLHIFLPATVTDKNVYQSLELDWDDFEDSIQYIVGGSLSVNYIVTRNIHDFSHGNIDTVTPEQFIQIIADNES